jgi:hypothetical protein
MLNIYGYVKKSLPDYYSLPHPYPSPACFIGEELSFAGWRGEVI